MFSFTLSLPLSSWQEPPERIAVSGTLRAYARMADTAPLALAGPGMAIHAGTRPALASLPAGFRLSADANNAAFYNGDTFDPGPELSRIMVRVADLLTRGAPGGPVVDVNGNTVGRWELTA